MLIITLSEKCKLKLLVDTVYSLKCLKLKRPSIPSVGDDVEELKLLYTAGGN